MSVRDVVQAAAGVGGGDNLYVEDVFSTYLYTGNSSTQTITNGINLDEEGGMVWTKGRTTATDHYIADTERGINQGLYTNSIAASQDHTSSATVTAFNSDGYTLGSDSTWLVNWSGNPDYVSWTFRKAPKFFSVVTWSGNDVLGREIAHDLGSTPGCIIVKKTNGTYNWQIYHNAVGATKFLEFNTLQAQTSSAVWNDTAPTDSVFTVGNEYGVNQSGSTYVAYLFAHDAGGFGDDGQQNVISCGSLTTDGSGVSTVNLGYEPQWVLLKRSNGAGSWALLDTMRGWDHSASKRLQANVSDAEENYTFAGGSLGVPTATGFTTKGAVIDSNATYIYIAIRRGPMKTPESGTEVFAPVTGSFSSPYTVTTNFPVDLTISGRTAGSTMPVNDRLRGGTTNSYAYLNTRLSDAELTGSGAGLGFQNNTAVIDTSWSSGGDAIWWNFRRAPGFMDVVCYTGTGGATTFAHNLAAVPELMISKNRSQLSNWAVYHKDLPLVVSAGPALNLDRAGNLNPYDFGLGSGGYESPTSSVFTVGPNSNSGTDNFVAYLFASCPGVSKVSSYTGTGADINVDCGFSAGARFVLIKRTDSTGDWYVWDSARGISAGNDPYILINDSPQVTTTDYIDPLSSGFTVTSNASSTVNVDTGTYIFLAIA